MEREKSQKKPEQGCSGYKLETTALISINNYNAFRIRRIMLILDFLKRWYSTYNISNRINITYTLY